MSKALFERTAFTSALSTFLSSRGWSNITYREGFQYDESIEVPLVSVHIVASGPDSIQIGATTEKKFSRVFQVDCYMENEVRAMGVADDISEFMEDTYISIKDKLNSDAVIGSLMCVSNESIYISISPPNLATPKVNRWRAIIRATYEAFYFA